MGGGGGGGGENGNIINGKASYKIATFTSVREKMSDCMCMFIHV